MGSARAAVVVMRGSMSAHPPFLAVASSLASQAAARGVRKTPTPPTPRPLGSASAAPPHQSSPMQPLHPQPAQHHPDGLTACPAPSRRSPAADVGEALRQCGRAHEVRYLLNDGVGVGCACKHLANLHTEAAVSGSSRSSVDTYTVHTNC